ncbi:MAG: sulfonate transport system substrate-binding protein, partial [Rhodospirillaceae bacterium]|nr:sulfonate transport system substrate-binding protein [Rhodospirillaceae bacterium]
MIKRRHVLAALPGAFLAIPALAQTTPKARELRFGYQRNGTLLIAKQQGVLETRLKPLGIEVKWAEFSFGPPLLEALNVGS